jgi:hypothetical protein
MTTRVIVCGGREFNDRELCFTKLDQILPDYENPEIVSGHAKGADLLGEKYAKLHSLPLKVFPACAPEKLYLECSCICGANPHKY